MIDNSSPQNSDDPLPQSGDERREPPSDISEHRLMRLVDTTLSAQTPFAAEYVAKLRRKNPDISPRDLLRQLDRQLLTTSTASGAAVGAAAAAPGVGTAVAAAMSLGEAAVSLQSAVFYVLALTEVHQLPLAELERRRTLVLAILLGSGSEKAIHAVAERTGQHWARRTLTAIPTASLKQINKFLGVNFVTKYGTKQGIVVLGKVVPFGFGAAIGGSANFLVAHSIIRAARRAFGTPPASFT